MIPKQESHERQTPLIQKSTNPDPISPEINIKKPRKLMFAFLFCLFINICCIGYFGIKSFNPIYISGDSFGYDENSIYEKGLYLYKNINRVYYNQTKVFQNKNIMFSEFLIFNLSVKISFTIINNYDYIFLNCKNNIFDYFISKYYENYNFHKRIYFNSPERLSQDQITNNNSQKNCIEINSFQILKQKIVNLNSALEEKKVYYIYQ